MLLAGLAAIGCGSTSTGALGVDGGVDGGGGDAGARAKVVEVVLFTHIEDQSPVGMIGSAPSKADYLALRAALLELAGLAKGRSLVWVLQPDWKFLEAALVYEDAALVATTGGKNLCNRSRPS